VIVDLKRFIAEERPYWTELAGMLDKLEADTAHKLELEQARRFHYLYERASADLGKISTFSSEPELRRYLESLVARAYGEIHEVRRRPHRLAPLRWFFETFPQTFRRQAGAFWLSGAVMLAGTLFGVAVMLFDPESKSVVMPFGHLLGDPSERVAQEEKAADDRLEGGKGSFSAYLIVNNTRVSIFAMALGATWGVGTIILLFYNGALLGAVAADYVMAGQTGFLLGWLLPHGSVEIPAILLAGQAGLVLARAMIGWGEKTTMPVRLRQAGPDLVTLIGGVVVLLVWAGFVEAFLSQYHEPVLPYEVKIAIGAGELILLGLFLSLSGRKSQQEPAA
jgi:uncharacterized membrane protein SpoIIM required for sporulation